MTVRRILSIGTAVGLLVAQQAGAQTPPFPYPAPPGFELPQNLPNATPHAGNSPTMVTACLGVGLNGAPLAVACPSFGAFQGAVPLTPGTPIGPGRAVAVNCTAAGIVTYTFADGSTLAVPATVGEVEKPFAVTNVALSGGASCTFANLK